MIDLTGVPHVLPLMIRKFLYRCYFLHIIDMKDIHRSNDLAISTMHHTFGNLQASVHVATYYTRSLYTCETNHVWLYMEYFHEALNHLLI